MKCLFFSSGPFNWVNGERCSPRDNLGSFANVEPRSGKVLAQVEASGPGEVERAVNAAKEAFPKWKQVKSFTTGVQIQSYNNYKANLTYS